jgi:NADPH:quinone reductase-like Zn-dependent oxidoreductase
LVVEDAPEPHAGPGEVRIRAAAASVNPIDWKVRGGHAREYLSIDFPAIPGRDAAGSVDEIGEGVFDVALGDHVYGLGGVLDATAEYVVLSAWASVPSTWTLEQAAGAGLTITTAAGALNALGDLRGRTLLVEGAAGGVGSTAVEIALARGARVIGTASEGNHPFLAELGALPTTYGPGLANRVEALSHDGVAAVLDAAGSGSLPHLVAIAGSPTSVVTVADFAIAESLGVRRIDAQNGSSVLDEGAEIGERGALTPRISRTFTLDQIATAHAEAERGHTRGKIVVRIRH